jgi:GNAT superfamily N-acetyltransferase
LYFEGVSKPEITIASVDTVPWDDVRTVFGNRGDPHRCWCQFFKLPSTEWETAEPDQCENLLQGQVRANDPAPGVIAYQGVEPVGWCAIEPRPNYSLLRRAKVVVEGSRQDADDTSVWSVTCFVVRVGFRRHGIAAELLNGAVEQARRLGARVIEGYPVDTSERPKAPAAELYHGTVSLFLGAGFDVVARPSGGRAVVELAL